jgi:hypothetical protein
MPVEFSFPIDKFTPAPELAATVTDALRESSLANTEYHGLVGQLGILQTALLKVNLIGLDDSRYTEGIVLHQAAV